MQSLRRSPLSVSPPRRGSRASEPRLAHIGGLECLIVERFDRLVTSDGDVERIQQEELCQALAIDPDGNGGRAKYERAGGPSLRQAATLLERYADDPTSELVELARAMTFTILIDNADAHGKNVALLHPTPTRISLAPLYDTVPTMLWPGLRAEAAMRVNGRASLPDITADDLVAEAAAWSLDRRVGQRAVADTAEQLLACVRPRLGGADDDVMRLVGARCEQLGATA